MVGKLTYEGLEQRIALLENESVTKARSVIFELTLKWGSRRV